MPNKKKPALSPEAARILEQYRKASPKSNPANVDPAADGTTSSVPRPTAPAIAPAHRSGTRGK